MVLSSNRPSFTVIEKGVCRNSAAFIATKGRASLEAETETRSKTVLPDLIR